MSDSQQVDETKLSDGTSPAAEHPSAPEQSAAAEHGAAGQPVPELGDSATTGSIEDSIEPADDPIDPSTYVSPADSDDSDDVKPIEEASSGDELAKLEWYILKVQSNREDSIRDALQRRVKIAGLEKYFDEIIVPTEMVTEFKAGKKKIVKRKLYPGYLVVHMEINEDTWFLVRETTGIGDFTGTAGKPSPMRPADVAKIVQTHEEKTTDAPKLKIDFHQGDRVKINEGTFENFEGDVDAIDEANGRVTVMINIFGRSTPVELEYWQIEKI